MHHLMIHKRAARSVGHDRAAVQLQLFAAQDLICKSQDQLLKIRQFANQPL
jgi:hypothetical protein